MPPRAGPADAHHLPTVPEQQNGPGSPASSDLQEPPSARSLEELPSSPFSSREAVSSGGSQSSTPVSITPPPSHLNIRHTRHAALLEGDPVTDGELLHVPTMRHLLQPIDSPLINDRYYGGGFVSDDDRVSLQSLLFATPSSRGANETRRSLGKFASPPLRPSSVGGGGGGRAAQLAGTPTLARTLSTPRSSMDTNQDAYFEATPCFALRAGPRSTIYFQPQTTRIAVVVSGGLCPGLNDTIRALVLKALDYGVPEKHILGIKRGFRGFYSKAKGDRPITLTRQAVEDIHLEGGSVLGTSEHGECDVMGVVKRLDLWAIDMLFVVGGQHDISTAAVIQKQCDQLSVPCSVIALPKSIDNDFLLLDKTFGFETAVEEAQKAILAAKYEAMSAYRGIGLVKLMGRHSGFIAVKAALASGIVDVVLVPEVPFNLDSMVAHVEHILKTRGHAVVCMAEGAAKDRIPDQCYFDPSRDAATCLEKDPGMWLKLEMKKRLRDVDIKYIDPSYLIRSIPATSDDRVYSKLIAHGAVHAGFAGYTACAVGQVNTHMVYLPLQILAQAPRQMDPNGELWNRLKAAIGQPSFD